MAITLIGAGGYFPRFGKGAHAIATLNTGRLTTVPTEVNEFIAELDGASAELRACVAGVAAARDSWKKSGDALAKSIADALSKLLIQQVRDDNPQEYLTEDEALEEVHRQMVASGDDVDASTVSATVTMGAANAGNGVILVSTKRGDGREQENLFAESIEGVTTDGSNFTLRGEVAITGSELSQDWPDGSGSSTSVGTAAGSLLTNGGFETADTNQTTRPDSWECPVATLGTTLKMTAVEVQTVAIAGTPASGSYTLTWVNGASKSQTTDPIAWNAGSTTVQAALRLLTGLESITIVESGTTPNFTHTITMTNVTNPAQFTATSALNAGSVTPATTTAGSANVHAGARSLEWDSDGSQLTQIKQQVDLEALTQYAVKLYVLADVVPAAGVMTVDLWDGSAVINDQFGTANSFTFTGAGLTTSMVIRSGFFRTPLILPPLVYLRIHISTAVSAGTSVFIDAVDLKACTQLYAGGPEAVGFPGSTAFQKGDLVSVAMANNRAGLIQEWFARCFAMRAKDLLLPVDTGGTETVADSLVA